MGKARLLVGGEGAVCVRIGREVGGWVSLTSWWTESGSPRQNIHMRLDPVVDARLYLLSVVRPYLVCIHACIEAYIHYASISTIHRCQNVSINVCFTPSG